MNLTTLAVSKPISWVDVRLMAMADRYREPSLPIDERLQRGIQLV